MGELQVFRSGLGLRVEFEYLVSLHPGWFKITIHLHFNKHCITGSGVVGTQLE